MFKNKNTESNANVNLTYPMPVTCKSCGFELPDDAEKNSGYFVNYLTCRDKNRNNKIITGVPGTFMQFDANGKVKGSSTAGYHLKENYTHVEWIAWCMRCHTNKTKLQDMSKKVNHMKPDNKSNKTIRQLSGKMRMKNQ